MNLKNRTWLIRHADHSFSRPISEPRLKELFDAGEMKPKDELCPANGYWFSLQDVREMRKHFGNIPMDSIFNKSKEAADRERFAHTEKIMKSADPFHSSRKEKFQMWILGAAFLIIFVLVMLYVWLS